MKEFYVQNETDLQPVAHYLSNITDTSVFLFIGDLGTGKTTLIKRICSELGVVDGISSPTFSLVNHYKTNEEKDVFHFDLYRIESSEEALDFGIEEYLDSGSRCLIEWPEKIMQLISGPFVEVEIKVEDQARIIKVRHHHESV